MPYLIKGKFVCHEKPFLNMKVRDSSETRPDPLLNGFKQHMGVTKTRRLKQNENIEKPNPFVDFPEINICKSFEMNKKAKSNTIRLFLKDELKQIKDPKAIKKALMLKLKNHFSQEEETNSNEEIQGFNLNFNNELLDDEEEQSHYFKTKRSPKMKALRSFLKQELKNNTEN